MNHISTNKRIGLKINISEVCSHHEYMRLVKRRDILVEEEASQCQGNVLMRNASSSGKGTLRIEAIVVASHVDDKDSRVQTNQSIDELLIGVGHDDYYNICNNISTARSTNKMGSISGAISLRKSGRYNRIS